MKRVLFVDDDALVLEGIEDLLEHKRRQWDMVFALGGEAALRELANGTFDVVVTDMRMPLVDGPTVLRKAQADHPNAVRIVLSGYAEVGVTLRALPVAHQFLSKPCSADELERAIERAFAIQSAIHSEAVRALLGKLEKLPSIPKVFNELTKLLANEKSTAREAANIIERDAAMCAKLLQIANSSFFRMGRQIGGVEEAVKYLGFDTIKNIALIAGVFDTSMQPRVPGFDILAVQQQSMMVARIATKLVEGDSVMMGNAFMGALLHDIGKIILASELPAEFAKAVSLSRELKAPLHTVEHRIYGATHAEIGAYVLGLWGLPSPIVECVAHHHHLSDITPGSMSAVVAVYAANILARERERGPMLTAEEMECLSRHGLAEQIPSWREVAVAAASREEI